MTAGQAAGRRVAMVTYFFPPLGGGGVQRTLKHIANLPQHGWQPVVITPRDPVYEIRDPKLVDGVAPGLEVHRSFILEPSRLYRWVVKVTGYRGRRSTSKLVRLAVEVPHTDRVVPGAGNIGVRPRLGLWANIARIAFFPDEQLGWVPFALRSLVRANRSRRIDALYSSSPPISVHLIAGLAKGRLGVPWIADFRDPWVGNAFAPPLPWIHERIQRRLERWIVRRADRVLFATPSLTRAYADRYPDIASRFVTMTNGYDRDDLQAIPSRPAFQDGKFRLIYAGSLYGEHELALFLDGLGRALSRDPSLRGRLRVEFVGWLSGNNQAIADRAVRSDMFAGIVTFEGFLPRNEALRRVASADAALHLLADEPGKGLFVAGKLFDYLGLDRPILAVVPEGDVRQILRELDWGVVADPEPEAIAAGLDRIVSAGPSDRRADPNGRYDRAVQGANLARLLDELIRSGARSASAA
jgi:glycosyltransferase involved in cell wall biosynthesis